MKCALPFCLALGALVAVYSLKNRPRTNGALSDIVARQDQWWQSLHKQYVGEFAKTQDGQSFDVVFYGDSITESWRGTDQGHPIERAKGVDKVFEESFGAYNGRAFGIGGDQSAHLLWRVLHSELAAHAGPQVIILNIGTNDLGNARAGTTAATERQALLDAVDGILDRVSSIVAVLRRHLPDSFIVLSSLLPRAGEGARRFAQPSAYTESLGAVNAQFQALAGRDGVVYHDCAHVLLNDSGDIEPALLPDGVHPSPAGYALLAKCYLEAVKELIGDPRPRPGREEAGAEASAQALAEAAAAGKVASVRLGLPLEAGAQDARIVALDGAEGESAVAPRRALLA